MNINGKWYSEPELAAYVKELEAKVAELEDKHFSECRQIAHYDDELSTATSAAEIFTAVFGWYSAVCKKTQDCDECLFHVPRKDCFTDGDIEQLIAIARKFDIAHKDGGADNENQKESGRRGSL